MKRAAVVGAGSFGTALAIQLARRGTETRLWGRRAAEIDAMRVTRVNQAYLPDCPLPDELLPTVDLAAALDAAEEVLVVVPSHALRAVFRMLAPLLKPEQGIACAAKGLEPDTGKLAHEVFAEELGERRFAIISGPTFARELALGMPTAVTIGSSDSAFAEKVALSLHGNGFRAYTSPDVIGVEIGGAVKNVLAIAVGIADGLKLGANTRAALITRGLAEIMRLGVALGADADTLMGLSGLGDLVLTCTDNQSRNRRMGLLLAAGHSVEAATREIQQVVEGVRVAPEVRRRAQQLQVEMPITEQVCRVLAGEINPVQAVIALANRPARSEADYSRIG